jgi:hypothetical protein
MRYVKAANITRGRAHLECDQRICPSDQAVDARVIAALIVAVEPVGALRILRLFEEVVDDGAHDGHQCEEEKVEEAASKDELVSHVMR